MDVVITGVSRGIGKALSEEVLKAGKNRVLGLCRDDSSFESLSDETKNTSSTFHGLKADLMNDQYLPTLVNMLVTLNFRPSVIINNAATMVYKSVETMTEGDFERCFRLNVWSPYRLIQALLPYIPEHSHIVNIGSMSGVQGSQKYEGLSVYSASKAALINLTECLAEELKPRKIHVNAIAPGMVKTQMLEEAFPEARPATTAAEAAAFIWAVASGAHKVMNGRIICMSENR